ncbi:MAG: chromosome partitioning protein [Myxococcales bacterium]|nr:chromosome partitioning protein [Myxococcales bacterium]
MTRPIATSPPLSQTVFHVVTGKGGVGKSAVAVALARTLASQGHKKVLLATTGGDDGVSSLLKCQPLGRELRELVPGIWGVSMTGESAREEYARIVLKYDTVVRLVFGNPLVRHFLDFVPGLGELNQMGKLYYHQVSGDFDHIVLDGPASGHAVTLLTAASKVVSTVPPGPLSRDTRYIAELVTDPGRTAIHLVTLPSSMSCRELFELGERLAQKEGMAMGYLFANRMPAAQEAEVEPQFADDDAGRFLQAAWQQQTQAWDRVRGLAKRLGLPLVAFDEVSQPRNVVDQLVSNLEGLR